MSDTYAPCPECDKINRVPLVRAEHGTPLCGSCQAPLQILHGIVQVSGTGLQRLMDRVKLPIVTDFWAPGCAPCRAFEGEFQKAASQLANQVVFTRLNSMEHALAADAHGIKTLPTIVVFRGGAEVDRRFGAISREALVQWLRSVISPEISREEVARKAA